MIRSARRVVLANTKRAGALTGSLAALLLFLAAPAPALAQVSPTKSLSPTTVKLPDGPGSVQGLTDSASINVFSGQVEYSV
ncbi:MAG: hypothetical protein V2A73_04175, partial [Pseudomonadota bacterium]